MIFIANVIMIQMKEWALNSFWHASYISKSVNSACYPRKVIQKSHSNATSVSDGGLLPGSAVVWWRAATANINRIALRRAMMRVVEAVCQYFSERLTWIVVSRIVIEECSSRIHTLGKEAPSWPKLALPNRTS